jgi:hypothetical protein
MGLGELSKGVAIIVYFVSIISLYLMVNIILIRWGGTLARRANWMKLFVCRTDQCGWRWETVHKCSPVREPKWSSMVRNTYIPAG